MSVTYQKNYVDGTLTSIYLSDVGVIPLDPNNPDYQNYVQAIANGGHSIAVYNTSAQDSVPAPTGLLSQGTPDEYLRGDLTWANFDSAVNVLMQNIIGASPAFLNTLQELATALNNDPDFGTHILTQLGSKVDNTLTINGYSLTSNVILNKNDVGLSNVDNISDANKPVSTAVQTLLNNKVDVVAGKGLSSNDFTSAQVAKLGAITPGATVNAPDAALRDRSTHTGTQLSNTISDFTASVNTLIQNVVGSAPDALNTLQELAASLNNDPDFAAHLVTQLAAKVNTTRTVNGHALTADVTVTKTDLGLSNVDNTSDVNKPISTLIQIALNNKVDVIANKGLSANDFTTALLSKLNAIAANATANPNTDSLTEGTTNLYLTNTRVRNLLSATGQISYNSTTGVFDLPVRSSITYATLAAAFTAVTTATVLSATRDVFVSYDFDGALNLTVLGTQTLVAVLKYADNAAMTTNAVTVKRVKTQIGGVAGLNTTQTLTPFGVIPAGKYRQVTFELTQIGLAPLPTAPTACAAYQELLL